MASLKMDELLVTWLNSEGAYESIMSMIKQHKQNTGNFMPNVSPKIQASGGSINPNNNYGNNNNYLPPLSPLKMQGNSNVHANQLLQAGGKGKGFHIGNGSDYHVDVTIPLNSGGRGRGKALPGDALEVRDRDILQVFSSIGDGMGNRHNAFLRVDDFGRLVTKPLCGLPTFFTAPLIVFYSG